LFNLQRTNILGVLKGEILRKVGCLEDRQTQKLICETVIGCHDFLKLEVSKNDVKKVAEACIERCGDNDDMVELKRKLEECV